MRTKTGHIVCGDRMQLSLIETAPPVSYMGERFEYYLHVKNLWVLVFSYLLQLDQEVGKNIQGFSLELSILTSL